MSLGFVKSGYVRVKAHSYCLNYNAAMLAYTCDDLSRVTSWFAPSRAVIGLNASCDLGAIFTLPIEGALEYTQIFNKLLLIDLSNILDGLYIILLFFMWASSCLVSSKLWLIDWLIDL